METYYYGRQMEDGTGAEYVQEEADRRDVTAGESNKRMETYYYGGRMWNGGRVCTGKTQPARCTYRRPMDGWKPTTAVVRWMWNRRGRSMHRKKPAGEM